MKNIKGLKSELQEILGTNRGECNKRQLKVLGTRAAHLQLCIAYLETSPDEEYLKAEAKRIDKRIQLIKGHAGLWMTEKVFASDLVKLKAYLKEYGVPNLMVQYRRQ